MQSFSRGCFGFFTTWLLPPARASDPEASEEACLCAPISNFEQHTPLFPSHLTLSVQVAALLGKGNQSGPCEGVGIKAVE